jgi:DNA mismatch repair protein MutL
MMPPRIRVLPREVANRIAAGEVVERPASVVKELLENAVDAGATSISVDMKGGGIAGIRVSDDGCGMGREDALLAFERHATSKLAEVADLFSLTTFGFRGEALPSIAAVSKVRLVTAVRDEARGTELVIEGGKVLRTRDAGAPPGTLIEVEDLFYNTPARRKFLRSSQTEISHAVEALTHAALAHPEIRFRLSHEGRPLADFPGTKGIHDRVLQVFGEKRSAALVQGSASAGKVELFAFLSRPTVTQGSRKDQLLYVNNRPVRHPLLVHAVYEAYETLLRKGEHPFFVLFIRIDPAMVDVNVHPTKREVRFSEGAQVYPVIRSGLREILLKSRTALRWAAGPMQDRTGGGPLSVSEAVSGATTSRSGWAPGGSAGALLDPPASYGASSLPIDSTPRAVGQVYDTFLLTEIDGEMAIVDQHTAHERVLYERLLKQIEGSRLEVQRLLIPAEISPPASRRALLLEHLPTLNALGVEVEPSSDADFWVRSVPAVAVGSDPQRLLEALLDDLDESGRGAVLAERTRLLAATMACHSAVRAGRTLRAPEMQALLIDLLKTDAPFTCPHGRPTLIRYTREELEKQFHRT